MIFRYCSFIVAVLVAAGAFGQSPAHGTDSLVRFATAEESRALLTRRDKYIERLGALERALKAKSQAPVDERDFLSIVASGAKSWTDDERAKVLSALHSLGPHLKDLPLPQPVVLVRSTGVGEGNAPHTRGDAVILTDGVLQQAQNLAFVLAHELFHVASRRDRNWRNAMYATIGFREVPEVALPEPLATRRITNPDAPFIDAAIKLQSDAGAVWVVPVLQATVDRYDAARGGEFFAYLKLVWLEIGRGDEPPRSVDRLDAARVLDTGALRGFYEQVGRNTAYIIHPEEILADNFAQLATGKPGASPEVHQRLQEALKKR